MSDRDAGSAEERFLTLAGRGTSQFVVRGSEFVGHAAPVRSVAAAESFLGAIREARPNATHHVPAYRVRAAPFREYASDAGEPTGSAGKPALNVLQGRDLENAAVVVVRDYGGTDLGVGGLVHAYSRAAAEAVDGAGVVETEPHESFDVTVAYDDSGTVRSVLESAGVAFDAEYAADVTFEVRAPVTAVGDLRDRILSATGGRADLA